uniref:Uncharacterized protein n=1 Tax=Avena sativa TaxID=4498 RepID=A0ACD5TFA2_AVESA
MAMEDQAKLLADLTAAVSSMNAKLGEMHPVVLDLHNWKPSIEKSMETLRAEVSNLRDLVLDPNKSAATSPTGGVPPPLPHPSADAPTTSLMSAKPAASLPVVRAAGNGGDGHGQFGHGDESSPRGIRTDDPRASEGAPAKGKQHQSGHDYDSSEYQYQRGWGSSRFPPPPRVDFPLFDGENPRAWRLKCEAYFQVCSMNPETWVSCAAMYFMDDALSWLQATEAHLHFPVWKDFAENICAQFGRTEFQHYLRLFNRLQQTGTVVEYTSKFNSLMHNLTAHHNSWDPSFFVTHYIDGLQRDIRAAVVLHRPIDLATAVDLAILQEEVLDSYRRDTRRMDFYSGARAIPRTAHPLPPPLGPRGNPPPVPKTEERRAMEVQRPQPQEDKIAALRAYHRARGLCFICGERWGRDHRCGPTVQLHVVEELLAMIQDNEEVPNTSAKAETDTGSELMHLSQAAAEGGVAATTMRLQGLMQNQQVMMLVDSGSSHTFISAELVDKLQCSSRHIAPLRVKVANGGLMHCNTELVDVEWWTQGVRFTTSFKVLPLGSYDIILGFDWLTKHSPMKVHWGNQIMSFEMDGRTVSLSGVKPDASNCKQVSVEQLHSLLQNSRVAQVVQLCLMQPDQQSKITPESLPEPIQHLLTEFQALFAEPSDLPPQRSFDHSIPLCPGARPVNLRPYHYNPAQKDEIERQVK